MEPYKSTTDFDEFNNRFQPTGTYYESKEIKEEKKEKVEKKMQEIIEEKIEEERIKAEIENKTFNETAVKIELEEDKA